MRMDKSKAAFIAVFALVVVCAGSFFAVRSINNRVQPKVAVTVTGSLRSAVALSDAQPVVVTA